MEAVVPALGWNGACFSAQSESLPCDNELALKGMSSQLRNLSSAALSSGCTKTWYLLSSQVLYQ